jgi:hypothetical protein
VPRSRSLADLVREAGRGAETTGNTSFAGMAATPTAPDLKVPAAVAQEKPIGERLSDKAASVKKKLGAARAIFGGGG